MNGKDELIFKMRSGYSYFYVQTKEMLRTVDLIEEAIENYKRKGEKEAVYETVIWDYAKAVRDDDEESGGLVDPMKVFDVLSEAEPYTAIIAKNFHWFMTEELTGMFNKEMVARLQNESENYTKQDSRKVLIVVGDQSMDKAIPKPIQPDFELIEFGLPTEEEIEVELNDIVKAIKDTGRKIKLTDEEKDKLIKSARGLTKKQIQNAFAYSVIKGEGELKSKIVADIQARDIKKTAGLTIGEFNTTFDDIKGYDNLKQFALMCVGKPNAKGLILLGPAGVGKTAFSKALATETSNKIIVMELAKMMGEGLVGQAQNAVAEALEVVKANSPCILMIDEIEKGLGNVGRSSDTDGGTTKQAMSQLLKFLSDERPEGIYVIATCNDISGLPPEWIRAGRWDTAPFFIDLPNKIEKEAILNYYTNKYEISKENQKVFLKDFDKNTDGWSGAELESVCRIATMLEVSLTEASKFVVPVSKTMEKEIKKLKTWKDKTIPASVIKIEKKQGKKRTRKIDI